VFDTVSTEVKPMSSSYHSPDEVKVTCTEGYFFEGEYSMEESVSLKCQSNGSWSLQNVPKCASM